MILATRKSVTTRWRLCMRAASHEGLVGSFSSFWKSLMKNLWWCHEFNSKKTSPPEVFREGFSKKSRNFPPIPHDWLPSCITSIWWWHFSIELKVSKNFALWYRMSWALSGPSIGPPRGGVRVLKVKIIIALSPCPPDRPTRAPSYPCMSPSAAYWPYHSIP